MIGHELGGRYEIIERIGGGGMALVYKAHDILLGRNVAIKVLRQQFVHDEEFIRRFRREAQSAASLSHPNVVSIYDVGQEDDIHYIVMEYVEGHNLNEIIKERAPLQVDEAVRIASQICDALDHAHQNQIIHRDIKPHNILIGRNGRVKVTDFGIARAVTSTTITQTGSVVGSVHYFSPEHAKGVATGEKSDLYSLGIVLYQMLTARLPFLGESPISVALKHLQEEFEEPREVNPLIPQSVENIILKSMRKNPQERYQSAKEMLHDLETCLSPERRDEQKLYFTDYDEDEDRTRVIPAIKPQDRPVSSRGAKAAAAGYRDEQDEEQSPDQKQKKKWVKPFLWISITVLFLAALTGVVLYVNHKLVVPNTTVPKVIGMEESKAREELSKQGIEVDQDVIRKYNPDYGEGIVFAQSKPEGTEVKQGSSIQISVGIAKPTVKVPDVKNQPLDKAIKMLTDQGFKEDNIKPVKENSEDVAEGSVISQEPGVNAEVDADTQVITLTVSKGPETFKMPDLINKTMDEAKKKLDSLGLKLETFKEEPSFTIEKGKVTRQWPFNPDEQVSPGKEITLFVSSGYPPEAVNYTLNLPVTPVQEGTKTKIRIEYSDATTNGERKDWGTKTVNTVQQFPINLVLAPNKDAEVRVYQDGQLFDTYPISYNDVKNGTVPSIEFPVMQNYEDQDDEEQGDQQDNEQTGMNWGNDKKHKDNGKHKGKNNQTVIYKNGHP